MKASDKLKRKLAPRKRRVLSRPQVSDDDAEGGQTHGDDGNPLPLRKKRPPAAPRKRRQRVQLIDENGLELPDEDDGERQRRKRTKKKKEQDASKFKSAQFIQVSPPFPCLELSEAASGSRTGP